MSYFPTDIPFMSDDEKKENGIRSYVPDTNVGNTDYIRRQDAIRLAEQGQIQGFPWQFQMLVRLPPADIVQGRHGRWIKYTGTGKEQWMCSECSAEEKNPKVANYCYHCGAKMIWED